MMRRRRVRAHPDGGCELRLGPAERDLLRSLGPQLTTVLSATGPPDPVTARLFPAAYPDDAELQAEYEDLVGSELSQSLLGAVEVLAATADAEHLGREEADAWLRALNQARLVLATRLEISEEGTERPVDPSDSRRGAFAAYDYLSLLQEELIEALGPPTT